MKKLLFSFMLMGVSLMTFAQSTWTVDPMHSTFGFKVKHMGISFIQGRFDKYDGTITTTEADLNNAKFNFTIETASIDTDVEPRDNHLRNADFFDVAKFPTMTFVSTSAKKLKGNNFELKGNLTIKGITKPITVVATYGGTTKNQQGKEIMGFQTKFKINRLDYGISTDPAGAGIGTEVEIDIFTELVKK